MSDIIVGSVGVQLVPSAKGFPEKVKGLLQGLTADVILKPATEKFRAELEDATRTRAVTVNVNADTGAAEAKIDAVARTRSADIKVNARGLTEASAATSSLGGGFGTLIGLAGVFGAALVPVGAALGGIAAVAVIAGKAVLDVEKKQKLVDQLRKTAATSTSKATADAATSQANAIEASMSRSEKSFLSAQSALGGAFSGLIAKVGPVLFAPLAAGLRLIAQILPALAPLIRQTAGYLGDLIGHLSAGVANGGFANFLGYVQQTLPHVIDLIVSLGKFLGHVFVGLAPAGSVLIGLLTQVFNVLAAMPADVVAPLAAALIGLFGGPVLAGIAGAAVALMNLYASSEAFRNTINAIASALGQSLKPIIADLVNFWNSSLLPAIKQLAPVVAVIASAWLLVWSKITAFVLPVLLQIASILLAIVVPAIRTLLRVFLTVVGAIVNGAAHAFGWVPLVGGKLKGAAADFDNFRDSVNASLDGISGHKTITIDIFEAIREGVHGINPNQGNAAATLVTGAVAGAAKPPKPKVPTIPSFGSGGGGGGGGSVPKPRGGGGGGKASAAAAAKKQAKSLLAALTAGLKAGGPSLTNALTNILSHLADFPKQFRDRLRSVAKDAVAQITKINSLKSAMKDLASSIKSAFDPSNLFGGTLGGLRGGLVKALVNVTQAAAAQKALLAAGVSASFVAALLSSGNGALAAQIAANPAMAKDFASQYAAITKAAGDLGTSAAGAVYNPQIDTTNTRLQAIEGHLKTLAPEIGKVINRSVPKGRGK